MAKKKSKSQRNKKNQKKKVQATQLKVSEVTTGQKKVTPKKKKVQGTIEKKTQNNQVKKKQIEKQTIKTTKEQNKKVVDKNEIKYNVVLNEANKPKKEKQLVDKEKVEYNVVLTKKSETLPTILNNVNQTNESKDVIKEKTTNKFIAKIKSFVQSIVSKVKSFKKQKKNDIKKVKNNKNDSSYLKKKNVFFRLFNLLKNNFHIIFNVALIVTFVILLIGLIRTNAFTKGTIIYISCLVIFLMIVAIGYNRYLSGKVFSIFIIAGMSFVIYNLQYTYDFINNLNSSQYEYKTYYVVTFNNGQNKSIYNINNKKVCLLKDNSVNIERSLNTKLDSVNYVVHEDPNIFYQDFYNTNCRAIIVNQNQYKYMVNNIENSQKSIKILYEFKANGKK